MTGVTSALDWLDRRFDKLRFGTRTRSEQVQLWWREQRFLQWTLPLLLTIAVAGAYFWIFTSLVWARHENFGTFDYDLGMYDQGIWQLAHGRGFMTVRGMHVFAQHANFGYLLFVPAYWLGAGPHFLNIVNNIGVVAVAWPVYLLARHHLQSRWAGFWLVIAYLGHFSPQWKIQETFHPENLAAPFLVGAFYLATRGRWRWYWVCVLAALIWKEDVSLVVAMLGIVVWFLFRNWRVGVATLLSGAVWFLVATKVVMARYQVNGAVFDDLFGALGTTAQDVVLNSVRHPTMLGRVLRENKVEQGAFDLMRPYGYTGIVSPHVLALGAPQHVINFASAQNFTWDLRWHYSMFPYLAVLLASIRTVVTRRRLWLSWALIAVMVGGVVLTREQGVGPWASINYRAGYWPTDQPKFDDFRALMARIPDDAKVSAAYYFVPHLSQRREIYTFPNPWRSSNYGVKGVPAPPDPSRIDMVLVEERQVCPEGQAPSEDCLLLRRLLVDPSFRVVERRGDAVLLGRVRATPR